MMRRLIALAITAALVGNLPACQEEPEPEDIVLEQARAALAQGRPKQALEKVRALVERTPDDARLQRIYGEALIATGQASLAVWPLTRAMRDPEQVVAAGILLASAQLQGGSEFDAIETATRVIERAPDNHRAYILRSRAHLALNAEEQALADLDRAIELGLQDDTVDFIRIWSLIGLGKIEEAEALLETVNEQAQAEADLNPRRAAEVCAARAQFAAEAGNADVAAERFEECLDGPGIRNPSLVSRAIRFHDSQGHYGQGTDVVRRRFEDDESNLSARVSYTERLAAMGRLDEAEQLLLDATEKQPSAWSALVDFYVASEDFERALGALDKAIEANPRSPDAWFLSRADFLIVLGRVDEAETALAQIKLEPHRAVIEGRLLLARNQPEAAAKRFEEGLVLWPDHADLRYLTANAYERLGQWTRAASHFREAARQEPPHFLSSLAIADIMQGLGDREGRFFVLLRLADGNPQNLEVLEELLDLSRELGQEEQARSLFTRLSRTQGAQGRAVANVARAARTNEGLEHGLEMIDSAGVDLAHPVLFEALALRTKYLVELNRSAEAITQLDGLLSTDLQDPHAAEILSLRGGLAFDDGRLESADADFERALQLAPAHLEAAIGRARTVAALGNDDAARALYLSAVEIEGGIQNHDGPASVAHAHFERDAGDREASKRILRGLLIDRPRNGEAALLLAQILREEEPGGAYSAELLDVARRALLFEQSPEAAELRVLFPDEPKRK